MITDKQFVLNPDKWPQWPFLPMKRYVEGNLQTGCLIEGQGLTVYRFNMFSFGEMSIAKQKEVLRSCEKASYPDVIELLKAWEID